MDIVFYEAMLLSAMPVANGAATLDDIHKQAWSIFTRGRSTPFYGERPFIFRFEPVSRGQLLLTIRARQPFHGASFQVMEVARSDRLSVDLTMIPTRRRNRLEYTPRATEWPSLWANKLTRSGFDTREGDVEIELLERCRWNRGQRKLAVVNGRVTGTVHNEAEFAHAWLHGLGRRKAYGLGMLRLVPDAQAGVL